MRKAKIGIVTTWTLPIVFAFCLFVAGCGTASQTTLTPSGASVTLTTDAGGLGIMSAFRITIYENGVVQFEGVKNVNKKGFATRQIDPLKVAEIFSKIQAINFWELNDEYSKSSEREGVDENGEAVIFVTPPLDLQTWWVVVTAEGRAKKVEDYWGAPKGLHELENLIIDNSGTVDWISKSWRKSK